MDVVFLNESIFVAVSKQRNVFVIEMDESRFDMKYYMKAKFRSSECLRCMDQGEF